MLLIAGDLQKLKVIGKVYAGEVYSGIVTEGTAVK